jgi:hypothetical protein
MDFVWRACSDSRIKPRFPEGDIYLRSILHQNYVHASLASLVGIVESAGCRIKRGSFLLSYLLINSQRMFSLVEGVFWLELFVDVIGIALT